MKLKAIILATASTISMMAWGASANAQTAQDQAAPETSADAAAAPGDAIVVTGLRRSMASSRALKRNSDQIVDAVVAAEIGKLPDTAVSDSLARVTGVTVGRNGGEADSVLVRGLPNIATSYNGRDIFTAEGRFVASQDFAAGNVAALEVFKSTTADQVEGGIAGLINVRGRRPFDFKGREISGMANYLYANQSKDYAPNGNLLISNRWSTGAGEFGALLNVSYNRFHFLDSKRFIGSFVSATLPGGAGTPDASKYAGKRFGDLIGINYAEHDRERPSANAALQWRPNEELELYADFLYQGYRSKVYDRNMEVPLWGGSQYNDIELSLDNSRVESMTVDNPVRVQGWQAATTGRTDTYQVAAGGKWKSGPWTVSADLASTQSKFFLSVYSWDFAFTSSPSVHVDYDAGSDGGVNFTFENFDTTNPANGKFRGFFDRQLSARGRDIQFRTDAEYRTNLSYLPRVRFGVRTVDRKAAFDNGERYNNVEGANILLASTGLDIRTTTPGFVGETYPSVRSWAGPTSASIRAKANSLRALVGFPDGPPPYNPNQHFTANEKSTAAYGQIDYAFDWGIPVDGIVGVRVVDTDESVTSSQRTLTSGYTDTLPTASMRLHVTNDTQIRIAANKTRTRPNFGDLNPNYVVNSGTRIEYDSVANEYFRWGGGSGNIDLKPYTSDNFDVTFEHYFGATGLFAANVFHRKVDGFINYQVIKITDDQFTNNPAPDPNNNGYATDTQNVRISVPYNANTVNFKGAEVQFTTFFDYDFLPTWATQFGIQANLTYMESNSPSSYKQDKNQPGVSRLTGNLTGMYENGPWSARLAYNARSKWLNVCDAVQDWGGNPGCEYTKGTARVDVSASYRISDNLSIATDLNNLFPKPLRVYRVYMNDIAGGGNGIYNTQIRNEETVYSVGIRFRY
ncbi:tonB-dependent receptor family protein [Asticcacaulis biprosthecium C19]|uniref:TonB-dependent receptor family protein n=1 Tax=Asticcacaulis biprosthecium C19 TaxID=715226 RepID=F4QJF5_9CAUL|nr:TonB-dependent receptor [Asticcacaulis biprosthecium]EGF93138.1 tonB-dependent receptor family protein [Asticcacaulis biprosthecium C19]